MHLKKLLLLTLLVSLCSCTKPIISSKIDSVEKEGELIVLTRYSTTSFLKNKNDQAIGFEHDLVTAFAKDMGWKVKFAVKNSTLEVIEDLSLGRAHMAAAGLTRTEKRKELFEFSLPYQTVKQKVVCGKHYDIDTEKDLSKLNILIVKGTSYEETVAKLKNIYSDFKYNLHELSSEETLEMIWQNRDLCTLIDSHILNVHRRYFPELRVAYEFQKNEEIAWAFNNSDPALKELAKKWLKRKGRAKVKELKNRYYGHIKEFDYYDTKKFLERIKTRLPEFKEDFKEAAERTGFEWTFLAAVAYQESQWNPKAVSPTGVRGLMMLTRATAKEMNIKNRRDPAQSIDGGSRYLRAQMNRLPNYVPPRDKKWFALASYNIGYYHLRDAMALAVLENKNPGSWTHLRQILPLLTKHKYYKRLRYGYARGLEPVIYVSRIRNYHELLLNQL